MANEVSPQDWQAACRWVKSSLPVELAPEVHENYLYIHGSVYKRKRSPGYGTSVPEIEDRSAFLYVDVKDGELGRVTFSDGGMKEVWWGWSAYNPPTEPPKSLQELIKSGGIGNAPPENRRLLLRLAKPFKGVYEQIHELLFPPSEHWRLHTGEEEYARVPLNRFGAYAPVTGTPLISSTPVTGGILLLDGGPRISNRAGLVPVGAGLRL